VRRTTLPSVLALLALLCASSLAAQAAYFPRNALSRFEARWFSQHLRAMHEPPLATTRGEVYRFLWLRTWGAPIAVRISARGDSAELVVTVLTGQGGYDPGHIMRRDSSAVSSAAWRSLHAALDTIPFWSTAMRDPPTVVGEDGAEWILEGRRSERYRLVLRWTPGATGTSPMFRAACLQFLSVAGALPDSAAIY
jgi:hypothetical protein